MCAKLDKNDRLYQIRHSGAHVLAQAVLDMFPEAKLAFGPPVDNGFYYDFELPRPLIPEDLKLIQKKMKKIEAQRQKFAGRVVPIAEARNFYDQMGQVYKVDQIDKLASQGETEVTFYENILPQTGEAKFVDLCGGGHTEHTGDIGAYKLDSIAGAYFRGDENNTMLTRIYALCFETQDELKEYEKMMAEARKRDHRKLGKDLELFAFDDEVGAGLPLWLPKGAVLVEEIEQLGKRKEKEMGYSVVRTPHIAKEQLYLRSGHLPYYEESMYPSMDMDNEKYYLKAMNCPHHHKIFGATPKSYKDLPVRLSEYGTCYRNEGSGSLFGLMRVRSLCMNDAHIYCTNEQFEEEFSKVIDMYMYYFELFGIEKYQMRLSKHSDEGLGKKYVDDKEQWVKCEEMVRSALIKSGVPFVEEEDEAAFYGPKIDVQIWSAIGREFTLATNQIDFAVPARFNLTYTDADGSEQTPLCIHRAPLSTHERLIGFLIEHYAGAFPVWLAPVQVDVICVSHAFSEYGQKVVSTLESAGLRVQILDPENSLSKNVRLSETKKVPVKVILGEKEMQNEGVTVRRYGQDEQVEMSLADFVTQVVSETKV